MATREAHSNKDPGEPEFSIETYLVQLCVGGMDEESTRREMSSEFIQMIKLLDVIKLLQTRQDCTEHLDGIIKLLNRWHNFWVVKKPFKWKPPV